MSYGYIYVAQVAMGADQKQTIKALTEAEAYDGPSLVICYAPCEMHSIKGGMTPVSYTHLDVYKRQLGNLTRNNFKSKPLGDCRFADAGLAYKARIVFGTS